MTLRTQTLVTSVERADHLTWLVHTERGTIRAPHVVFATNGYTNTLVPELEGEINAYRNQVVITEPAPQQVRMSISLRHGTIGVMLVA